MATIVQEVHGDANSAVTFASPVTVGNLIIAICDARDGGPAGSGDVRMATTITGNVVDTTWTDVAVNAHTDTASNCDYVSIQAKVATSTSAGPFYNTKSLVANVSIIYLLEVEGLGVADYETFQDTGANGTTIDLGSFLTVTSDELVVMGIAGKDISGGYPDPTIAASGYTEVQDGVGAAGHPWFWVGYQATPSGTVDAEFTQSGSNLNWFWGVAAARFIAAPIEPEPGVWVDWNQDGFGDEDDCGVGSEDGQLARMLPEGAGGGDCLNDNITLDVVSMEWTRGASSDHVGQPTPGTCTIIVKNGATATESGKYTPENTGSSLYGKLRPGLPVWIGRNADGTMTGTGQTVHGVWAGYVRQIVPVPEGGAADTPTAQILCEDPLGWYARQPVKVADALGRSYSDLRTAILDDIGESDDRRDLASETDTMVLSAVDSDSALRVLEAINAATASRHSIEPGDTKEEWYFYRVVDRHHKLTSATDFSLNADNIQTTAGYRVTEENVNNYQKVDVSPVRLALALSTVWTYKDASFGVNGLYTIRAEFEDFVTDTALSYTSVGTPTQVTLASYGHFAEIRIWASSVNISNLKIVGRPIIRDSSESILAEDAASQLAYGRRAGSTITSEYLQSTALAQGVADFLVWKFGTARPRMDVSMVNLLSTINSRTLYDTVALTFDRLYLAAKRMEIIGEQGSCDLASSASLIHWTTAYELQETPNQSALGLFTLDSSSLDGPDLLGR